MGDVPTAAPPAAAPSAPAAPAAAPAEVTINQNPVATPNPVGAQAPPAPTGDLEGSSHRPESRREAIKKAYEQALNPPPKAAKAPEKPAVAAEAKPGHNKPPPGEETERLDLKKRPSDQPRSERGQFAPRQQPEPAPGVAAPSKGKEGTLAPGSVPTLPEGVPYRDPPQRISERAKADWHATPESVRGDFHRMQQEFAGAYQRYRGDHEAMNPIRRFQQMAQQHGTTLERALTNYTSMEHKLRTDVVGGLDVIISNLNLRTSDGQKIGLRDIAYHVLNQSPEQLRQIQQGNVQQAAGQQIGALHQEIAGLKQAIQQMHTAQQFTYTRSAVDTFADSHPRFDELGDLIEQELKLGFDLENAYRRAELLRPGTHAAQTRDTSAQTRQPVDRSISGAPDGVAPSNGAPRRPKEASRSPRDAVSNAIRRVNGI